MNISSKENPDDRPQPPQRMNSEERSNDGVTLWICPECAFTFDAAHTDTDGGGYSCPLCAEVDLESRLAAALARIAAVEAERDAIVAAVRDWKTCGESTGLASNRCLLPPGHTVPHDCQVIPGDADYFAALAASPTPTTEEQA